MKADTLGLPLKKKGKYKGIYKKTPTLSITLSRISLFMVVTFLHSVNGSVTPRCPILLLDSIDSQMVILS